jgi:two-component system NtrC family sensor kinase
MIMGTFNPVDKKYRWISVNAIPRFRKGEKKAYQACITFTDITLLKEAQALSFETEALKRVNRTKTDLLANVSHELRTPLASIKGFIETLLEKDVEWSRAQQLDFLESANREADRLTFLIRDLLDMSRLDAGRMHLDRQTVTVDEILEAAQNVLSVVAAHHDLRIRPVSDLPVIKADKNRIAQVITNLVENACKFSPPGSRVVLSIKQTPNDIVFGIQDHGIGMTEETLNQLFNRFYQAQMVVTGKTRGTGLGLSITKGIVESHGGQIKVKSKLKEGSLFSFSIPICGK